MTPLIIGIAGGSGSGKTTFAHHLHKMLGPEQSSILGQDCYYIDQAHKFDHDGGAVNFDHPQALDFSLMGEHLEQLKRGQSIEVPLYDFTTHTRRKETINFPSTPIILVDGILIFSQDCVVAQLDYKIFIDCPEDLRFERRLGRDVKERGRDPEGVHLQFYAQVKPMHDKFVESSKYIADDIVTVDNFREQADYWHDKLRQER